jgi:hypothetical protein
MQNNLQRRKIDLVFVIDGTGSMTPCIDMVKNAAKTFYKKFEEQMIDMGSTIDLLRVKLIVFRDYECDAFPMEESPFYELPLDLTDFERALSNIEAIGGGDAKENGLEALHFAFNSDFIARGLKDREVIVLFTDTDALELKERAESKNYPKDMVDEKGLIIEWVAPGQMLKINPKGKRLVMYAPNNSTYKELAKKLPSSVFVPVELSSGMAEFNFNEIIKIIAASASN